MATPRAPLADVAARWRSGLMVASVVAALLTSGLLMRDPFLAKATVDIGGVLSGRGALPPVRLLPFESAYEMEQFFDREVFAKVPNGIKGVCTAKAAYSPDGLRLEINCRGRSESQVRERTLSALQPFLDRHARYYELAKNVDDERVRGIERRMLGLERMIEALSKPPVSGLSEAQLIARQLDIEEMRERMAVERLLGNQVSPTRLDAKGVSVANRRPGRGVWSAVLALAIGSGIFTAVFAARLKRIEDE